MKLPIKPFTVTGANEIPLVAHIPHAGVLIPQEHSKLFQITPSEIEQQRIY